MRYQAHENSLNVCEQRLLPSSLTHAVALELSCWMLAAAATSEHSSQEGMLPLLNIVEAHRHQPDTAHSKSQSALALGLQVLAWKVRPFPSTTDLEPAMQATGQALRGPRLAPVEMRLQTIERRPHAPTADTLCLCFPVSPRPHDHQVQPLDPCLAAISIILERVNCDRWVRTLQQRRQKCLRCHPADCDLTVSTDA